MGAAGISGTIRENITRKGLVNMGRKGYRVAAAYWHEDGTMTIVLGGRRYKFADIFKAHEWCKAEKVDAYIRQ